jgi:hypothetical protein
MPTERDTEDLGATVSVPDEGFHIHDAASANWALRLIVAERDYQARTTEWYEAETRRSQRREEWLMYRFAGQLEQWMRAELTKQYGKRRSLQLPAGVIGLKTQPTKIVVVDERALTTWCRAELPAAIKSVEHILKSEVAAHVRASGEIPPGAEIAGGGERFYIK